MANNLHLKKNIYFIYSYPKLLVNKCSIWIHTNKETKFEIIDSKIMNDEHK